MLNLALQNNDGSEFDPAEYQGNSYLLLVFFRGAWCNHCKKQLNELEQAIESFSAANCKILAISPDTKFNSSLLKSFLRLSFPVLSDMDLKITDQYDLRAVYKDKIVPKPSAFIYAPSGELKFSYIGADYDDRLSAKQILLELQKVQL